MWQLYGCKCLINNKCISCSDVNKGGIKNCRYSQGNINSDGIICKQCEEEYILNSDNNTCLKRNSNKELEQFNIYLELRSEKNKLICSRCKKAFSLIEFKCIYTPTLYDPNLELYYFEKNIKPLLNFDLENEFNFLKNDYLYRRTKFLPCKISVTIVIIFYSWIKLFKNISIL